MVTGSQDNLLVSDTSFFPVKAKPDLGRFRPPLDAGLQEKARTASEEQPVPGNCLCFTGYTRRARGILSVHGAALHPGEQPLSERAPRRARGQTRRHCPLLAQILHLPAGPPRGFWDTAYLTSLIWKRQDPDGTTSAGNKGRNVAH